MEWILLSILILGFILIFRPVSKPVPDLREELGAVKRDLQLSKAAAIQNGALVLELQEKLVKVTGQKKSSEVKTGFMAESLLPLTEQFPCDPKSLRFLGAPIDYISFNYDDMEITFIECKTGDSQLNDNQRKVRDMIEQGKVKFVTVRLNEKGIKVK